MCEEDPHFSILDAACPDEEVYLFSGDGHSVWLNSKALEVRGHAGHPTGLLVEDDCFAIWGSLGDLSPEELDKAVLEASKVAAARGIVGIVDFEMGWILPDWRRRIGNGNDYLQVEFSVYTENLDRAIETGLRTGDTIASTEGLLRMGNYKLISDGSLNTRTAFCHDPYPGLTGKHARGMLNTSYDDLVSLMTKASSAGINCSIHAIGDDANTFALNAFEEVGCEGTIEHAQLLAWEDINVLLIWELLHLCSRSTRWMTVTWQTSCGLVAPTGASPSPPCWMQGSSSRWGQTLPLPRSIHGLLLRLRWSAPAIRVNPGIPSSASNPKLG